MLTVYISHPYGGKEENKKIVEDFIRQKQKKYKDVTFISPIHTFGWQYNEIDYVKGINDCLDLLSRCDAIITKRLDEVLDSRGCIIEVGYARGKGLNLVLWDKFDEYMKRFDDDFEDDED